MASESLSSSTSRCRPRGFFGPERFFYDKLSYTGVHTCGGPDTVHKDSYVSSLRGGLRPSRFIRNPGLQSSALSPSGTSTAGRGPERFFYDKDSYTGVHTCGGPKVIDKENDPDGNFFRSLRPKRAHSQPDMRPPSRSNAVRPADSNVRFLRILFEETPASMARKRLSLLNARLERDRFGGRLPDAVA
ncbi:unnamed protein product [Effrenium voratum]|nr:unnamed protein product [Effrenium voratum]